MKKIILFIILLSSKSFAYTIIAKDHERFPGARAKVMWSLKGCETLQGRYEILPQLIDKTLNQYWNQDFGSDFKFISAGKIDLDLSQEVSVTAALDYVPVNTIVVGCNHSMIRFVNNPGLGMSGKFACANGGCSGMVLLNTSKESMTPNYDDNVFSGMLARSFGLAIGLGGSRDSESVMYYYIFRKYPDTLSIDDQNALKYLYP